MNFVAFNKWFSLTAGFLFLVLSGCSSSPRQEGIDIADALSVSGSDVACYETARQDKKINFPEDLGPHDGFRTEWWYYTGNLKTAQGRHFGYQLTFFRQALSCDEIQGASEWRTRQIYFAHFAVTDTGEQQFFSDLRMNRHSLGVAGASSVPYQVWVDQWRAEEVPGKGVRLTADSKGVSLSLLLTDTGRLVLQGDRGFSRKGSQTYNASHYYSQPRLDTTGSIKIGSESYAVSGLSWFDREWSTGVLDEDVAGWDWFSVHLDDGRDLMVCLIRDSSGQPNGYGFGSIFDADGGYEILTENDFSITPTGYWKSPKTGRTYPGRWNITVSGYGLLLDVNPVVAGQEHTHMFPYWEGAAKFSGKDVSGYGYIEMTGY